MEEAGSAHVGTDIVRKGQISTLVRQIAQVLFGLVFIGVLVSFIPGFGEVFAQSGTSREVNQLVTDIEDEVCVGGGREGMLPPPDSPKAEYDFSSVDSFESDGSKLKVLVSGSDSATEIGLECEDVKEIVVCSNEEEKQFAAGCSSPGDDDTLSPGSYKFDYFLSAEGRLYLMVHKEVEDEGPYIYYLAGGASNYELKAVSLSERRIYEPKNMMSGVAVSKSYSGDTISYSGDADMDGLSDDLLMGNESYFFRYSMDDFNSESIRYDNPIKVHDLGTISDIREGEAVTGTGSDCEPEKWNTEQNRIDLARILFVEARNSNVNEKSRIAIGYTVVRRMKMDDTDQVGGENGVIDGYGHGSRGKKHIYYAGESKRWDSIHEGYAEHEDANFGYGKFLDIAEKVLTCQAEDVSQGATNYYSPRSMPNVEGTVYNDLDGSLGTAVNSGYSILPYRCDPGPFDEDDIDKLTEKILDGQPANYIPPWANPVFEGEGLHGCSATVAEHVDIEGVNPWYYKFYNYENNPDYNFYKREFGDFGGNEILFINGSMIEEKRELCVYNYLGEKALECLRDSFTCSAEDIGPVVELSGEKKVLFANGSRNIFFWDGRVGEGNYGCGTGSEFTGRRGFTGLECTSGSEEDCTVDKIGSAADMDNDGEDEVVVVISGKPYSGTFSTVPTYLAYLEIPEGQEEFEAVELVKENDIVSIGEIFDGKIPMVVRKRSEFMMKYYDTEEEEIVDIQEVDKPRKAGAFSDILGD